MFDDDDFDAAYNFARFLMLAALSVEPGVKALGIGQMDVVSSLDDALRSLAAMARSGSGSLAPFAAIFVDIEQRTAVHFGAQTAKAAVTRVALLADGQG